LIECIEIQDIDELKYLAKRMAENLKDVFLSDTRRMIGSPSGSWRADVSFVKGSGDNLFWWSYKEKDKRGLAVNLFGHGDPAMDTTLLIDIQLNISVDTFKRTSGGAFLKNKVTNEIYLAHRGIVTSGRSRLRQVDIIRETKVSKVQAETGTWTQEFMIVGVLHSDTLAHDIADFALKIRRAAKVVVQERDDDEVTNKIIKRGRKSPQDSAVGTLRAYFKEFSGETKTASRVETVVDRFHGDVVDALSKKMKHLACLKSGPIDLAVITKSTALIFEVKTSANSQSIYTAIGQLQVHAPLVKAHASGLPVSMIIVLPENPKPYLAKALAKLRIICLIFSRSESKKISFKEDDFLFIQCVA
jgi:hypothetical protein